MYNPDLIYQGDSVVVRMAVDFDCNENPESFKFADYDVEVQLFTRLIGKKIVASTHPNSRIIIEKLDGNQIQFDIPASETLNIPAGETTLKITCTHLRTGESFSSSGKGCIIELAPM